MKENAVKKFLRVYGKSFPLKRKFNFTGFCKDVKALIDEDYDYLLNKKKELLSKSKKRELLRTKLKLELNDINFNEKKALEIKKNNLLKKQKLMLSSYNNKMMLDLMFNNKKYIKYITEKSTDNFQTTRNNKDKNNTKKEFSINNMNENNIFSSLNTFQTIDEYNNDQKLTNFNDFKNMNKTYSKFAPISLKKSLKQNNTFFKTTLPKGNEINYQNIKNSLFKMHQKSNLKKYNINVNLPTLNSNTIDYNDINAANETEKKKKDDIIKTFFNYNKNLTKKIIFNSNQPKKDSVEKNNYFIENDKNNNSTQKRKNILISNSNNIKNIKTSIFKVKFNPIKAIYKTQINI